MRHDQQEAAQTPGTSAHPTTSLREWPRELGSLVPLRLAPNHILSARPNGRLPGPALPWMGAAWHQPSLPGGLLFLSSASLINARPPRSPPGESKRLSPMSLVPPCNLSKAAA